MPCSLRLDFQNSFINSFDSSAYGVLFFQFAISDDIKKYLRISQGVLLHSETQQVIPQVPDLQLNWLLSSLFFLNSYF